MAKVLTCWKCGILLRNVIFPMSRREVCYACDADQHVCKMCQDFDGNSGCNEARAESVTDKEGANFCDYFSPSGKTFAPNQTVNIQLHKSQSAKANLAALFGEVDSDVHDAPSSEEEPSLSPSELAEQKLRDMLGD